MAPRLEELSLSGHMPEEVPFETYKHCPALLGELESFPLQDDRGPGVADVPVGSGRVPSALEAEARAYAASTALMPLFRGGAAAAALGAGGIAIMELAVGSTVLRVDCGAPVLSLARIVGSENLADGRDGAESLLASCLGGLLAIVTVSRSQGPERLRAHLRHLPPVTLQDGSSDSEVPEGRADLYVTAARATDGDEVVALAHRVLGRREVEVVVLQLRAAACRRLAALRGRCAPKGACWLGPSCAMLIANAGFELLPSAPAGGEVGELPAHAAPEYHGSDAVLTVLWLRAAPAAPEAACWRLSRGELLGAWPEEGGPGDAPAGGLPGAGPGALAATLADGHAVLVLRIAPPTAPGCPPRIADCARVPGLGACASARAHLRWVLASRRRSFFVLAETHGRSAVGVFRHPEGAPRAPTAALEVGELGGGEVFGAFLDESAVVVLQRGRVVRCPLNARVKVPGAAGPLAPQSELPMGIDPKALLQMLDAHGED